MIERLARRGLAPLDALAHPARVHPRGRGGGRTGYCPGGREQPAQPRLLRRIDRVAGFGAAWQKLQEGLTRLDEREQAVLRQALSQTGGVVAQAARELGEVSIATATCIC